MLTDKDKARLRVAGKSLRKRIDLMCKDCIYDEMGVGTWRQQVTACTATECPLWEIRPLASTRERQ